MRLVRFFYSLALSAGLVLVLLGALLLLTEKIVIYPHQRSLPLLGLNSVEKKGFTVLSRFRGIEPRENVSAPDWLGWSVGGTGMLICVMSAAGIWTHSRQRL